MGIFNELPEEIQCNYTRQLKYIVDMFEDHPTDQSHVAWSVELLSRIHPSEIDVGMLCSILTKNYNEDKGWQLSTEWDRPSDTPELRCNEFLTSHTILSCSKLLRKIENKKLYNMIKPIVEGLARKYDFENLWIIESHLSGRQKADHVICVL
jgi:hypothetical protein